MTEPRIFRTIAVPLGIAVLFLVLTPKLCQRAVVQATARRPIVQTSTEPSRAGLVIASSTPAPGRSTDFHFPDGLDAARIEYLVEIDQAFATSSVMPVTEGAPITQELLRRQYVEKHPDGTLVPTREGVMNVKGATDSADGWIVPVAQRKFASVESIDLAGDGRYNVTARWRWEPTAIGATVLPRPADHHLTAEFVGGKGHWVLSRWIREPDRELR